MSAYCQKLKSIININIKGERAKKRPWSFYKPEKKGGKNKRINSAVLWRQRVNYKNWLDTEGCDIIKKDIFDIISNPKHNKWILQNLHKNIDKIQQNLAKEEKILENRKNVVSTNPDPVLSKSSLIEGN